MLGLDRIKCKLPLGDFWALPFLMGFALAALAVSLWLTITMTSCPSLVQLLKQVCASVMYSVPGNDTCTGKKASASGLQLAMLAQGQHLLLR